MRLSRLALFLSSLLCAALFATGARPALLLAQADPSSKVEPDRLRVDPTVRLEGEPFPRLSEREASFSKPRRVFYASPRENSEGDGSSARPWRDVQAALCRLSPGDRLVLLPGVYKAAFEIGDSCRSGTAEAPIQVFGEEAFLHAAAGRFGFTVRRAFWQFHHLQIILEEPGSKGFALQGNEARDILFDKGHIYEGAGPAVFIGGGSARVTISNSHIHQTGGIRVERGAAEIQLLGNKVHHNLEAGMRIVEAVPARASARVEGLLVRENKFHNDAGPALDLAGCRRVRVEENKFYNYRPHRGRRGEAVVLGPDMEGVAFERNYVAESLVGLRLGGAAGAGGKDMGGPEDVLVLRNYFENLIEEESVAIAVEAGRNLRIYNNTFGHYATGIRLAGGPPQVAKLQIANNIVLEASRFAFDLASSDGVAFFDHNAFGRRGGKIPARLGGKVLNLTEYLGSGPMPNSQAGTDVRLEGRDLATIQGLRLRDAGKAFEEIRFQGRAPDIGVAEK